MISFAGVGLIQPDAGLNAHLAEWWHLARVWERDGAGFEAPGVDGLPKPAVFRREPPRPGVLSWPTGASRWSTFHGFCSGDQLTQIRTALTMGNLGELVIDEGPDTDSLTTEMRLLPPLPIKRTADGKDLYLLTLVDDRYYWWSAGYAGIGQRPASWAELFAGLLAAVGVTELDVDAIPSGYDRPSARWVVGARPIPMLLDAACRTVGVRLCRTLDGVVKVSRWSTASGLAATQLATLESDVVAGGLINAGDVGRAVPASCAVMFPGAVTTRTLAGLALGEFGATTGVPGRTGVIWADLSAGSTDEMKAAYAVEATADYYLWQLGPVDAVFRGIAGWEPTGTELEVEWDHSGERIVTRVVRPPMSDANVYGDLDVPLPPEESSYYGSYPAGCGDLVTVEFDTVDNVACVGGRLQLEIKTVRVTGPCLSIAEVPGPILPEVEPFTVAAFASPTAAFGPIDVDLSADPAGGFLPVSYSWTLDLDPTVLSTNQNFTYSELPENLDWDDVAYTFTVLAVDGQGTVASDTVVVTVYGLGYYFLFYYYY